MNRARIAALFAELAVEFGAAASANDVRVVDSSSLRKRRKGRARAIVRPDDEETPEFIKALAARSLRERGFR